MNGINWHSIAGAIRERRFQDIPDETWTLVADKIDTNKRGRPTKPKWPEFPSQEWTDCADKYGAEWVDAYCEANDSNDSNDYTRSWKVLDRYNELREQGESKGMAQQRISEEPGFPALKTIEAILTGWRQTTTWNAKTRHWERISESELKRFLPFG